MKVKEIFQMVRTHDDNEEKMRPIDYYDVDIMKKDGTHFWSDEEAMEMEIDHIDIEGRISWDGECKTPYIGIYVK